MCRSAFAVTRAVGILAVSFAGILLGFVGIVIIHGLAATAQGD